VDGVFSFAVFEHVPRAVAQSLIAEAKRILKPGGFWYALIGLHDHFAMFDSRVSKVHFLRHSEALWTLLTSNSISYHNRLRERDFLSMLKDEGGSPIDLVHVLDTIDLDLVRTMRLATRFRAYTPEELAVTRTGIVATFNASQPFSTSWTS